MCVNGHTSVSVSAKKSSRSLSQCPFQWADVNIIDVVCNAVELIK